MEVHSTRRRALGLHYLDVVSGPFLTHSLSDPRRPGSTMLCLNCGSTWGWRELQRLQVEGEEAGPYFIYLIMSTT